MCGIAGLIQYDRPGHESLPAIRTMLQHLRHRGPDDEGTTALSSAALGNVRLSFFDRAHGTQPMSDPARRWWITYNGEVYNYRALRAELADDWDFQSDSDTEVVLAAIVTWGPAALDRFNGMFAFFVWDDLTQTGFAARDRLGVKPFAYLPQRNRFLFASEAKALLPFLPGQPRPNFDGITEYLAAPYFSGVEHATFEGIHYLPAGHWLRITREGYESQAWWDWSPPDQFESDSAHLTPLLAEHITSSVGHTLTGEYTCAVFLSGGLDSSLIAAVAAQKSEHPISAYTIQFADQEIFDYPQSRIVRSDDTPHARAIAESLGLELQLVPVSRESLASDLARLAAINDALPAWEQELAQHHLSRVSSRSHRVVLVGDAADETHYGYSFLLDAEATTSPRGILERFGPAPFARHLGTDVIDLLDTSYRKIATDTGYNWDTPHDRLLATTYLIVKRWLPRLLHNGDIHTMAFSLEARVPFADTTLIELARRVHPDLGKRDGEEKHLLRNAARGFVPETQRLRRKSALPKDQQSAAIYQVEARRALRESRDFLSAWLDLDAIEPLLASTRRLSENERSLLFRIISLHHWCIAFGVTTP